MTKPISRKMAVDALLWRFMTSGYEDDGAAFINCAICNRKLLALDDIEFDHVHAYVHGGEHDFRNLRPLHGSCHKVKTKADIQANAKVKRLANPKPSKWPMQNSGRKIPSRPFPKRANASGSI